MVSFQDYPDFRPHYTPKQMFSLGIFSGMYFRPIHSSITGKDYIRAEEEFSFLSNVPKCKLFNGTWSTKINKYNSKASSPLEYWESHGWIKPQDPYGWVQWYCRFYDGRRTSDDRRQIDRALGVMKRFGNRKMKTDRVKQALLHWAWDWQRA